MPAANANALRLLLQTCSYMNEQAAVNEMDSQALAEVGAQAGGWLTVAVLAVSCSQLLSVAVLYIIDCIML
jgi:hypothetical protein